MSLKVVKFDAKMDLNFSNFQGTNLGWGGTSLGPKTGTSVGWGIDKIFAEWWGPPGKNPDTQVIKLVYPTRQGRLVGRNIVFSLLI